MTKYYDLLIKKLINEEDCPKKDHYLFLLGTAVNYVDRPVNTEEDHFYIRGETFSYTAQLTSHLLGEEQDVIKHADSSSRDSENYAHAYHSSSVDVINGADTPGFEAGDRLAKALMLALGAVAEGKDRLHISGFSRGGVEAIVLTHELERVKRMLVEDLQKAPEDRRNLTKIIADSSSVPSTRPTLGNPSYTRAELKKLVGDSNLNLTNNTETDNEEALKEKLLHNLEQMKVDLFVLDPVPGGNFGRLAPIGWYEDDHFFTLPECVENKLEFVQQHETSRCFKPIVPLGMPYEVIPGCHGTADGNQFDDNSASIPRNLGEVYGAQDMVLRRWIDFTFPNEKPDEPIDLGHEALDEVVNQYVNLLKSERDKILLENYKQIQENFPAFEFLATINYTGLGRYMALRQIHFHQYGNTPVTDLDVHGGGKFLNLQHVQLWMSHKLQSFNFFEKSLPEQVVWLEENIKNAFSPPDESLLLESLQGDEGFMIAKLMHNRKNLPLVEESLSFLVNTVTLTYMRNHLTQEERETCKQCVLETFNTLKYTKKSENPDPEKAKIAESMYNNIRNNLTNTMLRHQNSLLSLSQKLLQEQQLLSVERDEFYNGELTEENSLDWLTNTQKLIGDLSLLTEQTQALQSFADQELLNNTWENVLPNLTLGNQEEVIDFEQRKAQFLQYIEQQKSLLITGASAVLKKIPNALEEKPEELEKDFYLSILPVASIDKNNSVIIELLELNEQAKNQIDNAQLEIEQLNQQFDQALAQQAEELQEKTNQLDQIRSEKVELQQRLIAFQSPEQREAMLKVHALKNLCNEYIQHLEKSNDQSELLQTKKIAVNEMLDILNENEKLPTEQLQDFNIKLKSTADTLKQHRDPAWQRFFRDCIRIIAIAVSGVGFYRMLLGQSPHFFKPSHGEKFVEEAEKQQDPSNINRYDVV